MVKGRLLLLSCGIDFGEASMAPDEAAEDRREESSPGAGGTGRMVYRAMREDLAGGPMIGLSARALGARPYVDIPVVAGQVHPNTGGMSVAPDRPENLHPLRRPPAYGGSGKDPVWCIGIDLLGPDLLFRQDSPTHGLIEPSRPMPFGEYQQRLADTKPFWRRLP
jgi:hypothetical protein